MTATTTDYAAARRSTRVRAQIPLRITSLDKNAPFAEQCHTLILNLQGCGVRMGRHVNPGVHVEVETVTGNRVPAVVVNSLALGNDGKYWLVGLALEEPGNVWGLNPAPADWGAPKLVGPASEHQRPMSTKPAEWPYAQFSNRGEFHPGRK
jgi:hypothetical protein